MATDDELKAQILRYHFVEHWRVGTIASQLGVHHSTVERVLGEAGVERERQRPRRPSKLDPYMAFITETLERFPTRAIHQTVLTASALMVVLHLILRRLPNIDHGLAGEMLSGDLAHRPSPCPWSCSRRSSSPDCATSSSSTATSGTRVARIVGVSAGPGSISARRSPCRRTCIRPMPLSLFHAGERR